MCFRRQACSAIGFRRLAAVPARRLIERPRPVPPYLRLVVPSACWKASKMMRCLSEGMPMPVSETEKAIDRFGSSQNRMTGAPAAIGLVDGEQDRSMLGKLESV